nr:hypothetical protein [Tanacetum cinerariifolium]
MDKTLLKEAAPTSSTSLVSYEASKRVVNFCTLDASTKARASAEVIIPLSLVLEANARLGTLIMLDSYTSTMCIDSWSCLDFAHALIDIKDDHPLKDDMVIDIPFGEVSRYYLHTIKVEYEWKPPRCGMFGVWS